MPYFVYTKSPPFLEGLMLKRHRAIFPGLEDPSIVTAERLNCCVRYGNRCDPLAMGTDYVPLRGTEGMSHEM